MKIAFLLIFTFIFGESILSAELDRREAVPIVDDILAQLKLSDSGNSSKYFSKTVEIDILGTEKLCSKKQAEDMLNYFLAKHHISSLKMVHQISKSDYKLLVVSANTNNGKFRISISMKNNQEQYLITGIRIEKNTADYN